MSRGAAYGVVAIAAADLRRAPDHASELRSQLLLGECVAVLGERARGQWLRVTGLEDGYSGWMRAWALVRTSALGVRRWQARARARVVKPLDTLHGEGSPRSPLMPVFLGSRLAVRSSAGGRSVVELPDGRRGVIATASISTRALPEISLAARLRSLTGVPYLWGGRTPAGFDCSGFTQVVLAEQGLRLPRDARDQYRAARRLERGESPRPGDLVFFARGRESVSHVGIISGPGTFVHCRGVVREASLNPSNPLCEKDLVAQLRGFVRPVRGRAYGPIRVLPRAKSP